MDPREKQTSIESPSKPWRDAAGAFVLHGGLMHVGAAVIFGLIGHVSGRPYVHGFIDEIHSKLGLALSAVWGGYKASVAYDASRREQQDFAALKTENAQLRAQAEHTGQALMQLATGLEQPRKNYAGLETRRDTHAGDVAAEKSETQKAARA